jgi:hypothetical protein
MQSGSQDPARCATLEALSLELAGVSARLSGFVEEEARRRRAEAVARVTAAEVGAVVAARHARSDLFGVDLAHPGWSLLLELFQAHLEQRTVHFTRLAIDARVAGTTALRWVAVLAESGFLRREADPGRSGGVRVELSECGRERMEDYFVAVLLGLTQEG